MTNSLILCLFFYNMGPLKDDDKLLQTGDLTNTPTTQRSAQISFALHQSCPCPAHTRCSPTNNPSSQTWSVSIRQATQYAEKRASVSPASCLVRTKQMNQEEELKAIGDVKNKNSVSVIQAARPARKKKYSQETAGGTVVITAD